MRRRAGFTLIEMMVSVALVLFIMVILTEAFGKGLESFRTLKAIGDLEAKMRSAAALLRRDLGMDHFEGNRKLSDPDATWNLTGPPREGFFYLEQLSEPPTNDEGTDPDNIGSRRRTTHRMHFTVRARGNDRGEFFTAKVPSGDTILTGGSPRRTTFFDHPRDARFEDTSDTYSSQWAEVGYFLVPSGQTAGTTPLYTLYRCQYVMVADNSLLNWVNPVAWRDDYDEVCCARVQVGSNWQLYFSTPSDVARAQGGDAYRGYVTARALGQPLRGAKPLLHDVVSFDIQIFRGSDFQMGNTPFDSRSRGHSFSSGTANIDQAVKAIKISLRIYDPKTKLSRQMTIIQDL